MSTDASASHDTEHKHEAHHGESEPHGTLRGYLTGFLLSVVLTAIPFILVMTGMLDSKLATGLSIAALAAIQIVVHMIYFLHMNHKSEGGWTIMALIFTVVLVVIMLTGSFWVMYHLNTNMAPQDMSQVP
jgi:cytochrome o ubiquinol oxidase operon protein cyoD